MLAIFVLLLLQGPPAVPGPPPVPGWPKETPVERQSAYDAAASRAMSQKTPLAVFVGVPVRSVGGVVSAPGTAYQGEPRIIVGMVGREGQILGPLASDADIRSAAGLGGRAVPFAQPDGDLERGPWPAELPFPAELKRYRRAKRTQSIAVVDNRDSIRSVDRFTLEAKWHVPGGLLGVEGWRSDLYRFVPSQPRTWVGNISVLNSLGYFQSNRGYKREYPIGSYFADALSAGGRVFEIRYAEKKETGWDRYVAFKDHAARPAGYSGLKQRCVECHNTTDGAGTGAYGAGLIPGSDTVISDPFLELEQ